MRELGYDPEVVFVGLIILTAIDYQFFWSATTERIAPPEVSHQEITSFSAGNARGSTWSGCYRYQGRPPLGIGAEHGELKVVETNGVLHVEGSFVEPH